jgi:uncharacterized protein (TIGR02594 family)
MIDLFHEAFKYYGLEEITSATEHNEKILLMFKEIGHKWVQADEVSWCSAFINYLCKRKDYERSGGLDARSWLRVGIDLDKPELGCIVVLWRESISSWKGHVGFYINEDDRYIYVLGGNQLNSVCIWRYPKERLLSYRKLRKKYSYYFNEE